MRAIQPENYRIAKLSHFNALNALLTNTHTGCFTPKRGYSNGNQIETTLTLFLKL